MDLMKLKADLETERFKLETADRKQEREHQDTQTMTMLKTMLETLIANKEE
jgi:hypothetical protein